MQQGAADIRSGYVTVRNVRTRVVTCGGWLDETQHQEIVLIIPGNPGLTGYYEEFVGSIHERVKMPVWIVCHAGHDIQPQTQQDFGDDVLDLGGQIEHKVCFIRDFVGAHVKLHLVGHSVGCYIILKMLTRIEQEVRMGYLLFPAVERIGTTPNGRLYTFFATYFLWLILALAWVFRLLPRALATCLVKMYFLLEGTDLKNVEVTARGLIHPVVLRNIFFLASDEMQKITDLDTETVALHSHKLLFYYGKSDGWCPLDYYHDLKRRVPQANAIASSSDVRHAFVLNSSKEMACQLSEWIGNSL